MVDPGLGGGASRLTRRSGSTTGSGRSSNWWKTEKIAAFGPMPRASDKTATPVTTGVLNSMRNANRTFAITCSSSSASRRPRARRQSSFAPSMLPKRIRARRAASRLGTPERTRSSVQASR